MKILNNCMCGNIEIIEKKDEEEKEEYNNEEEFKKILDEKLKEHENKDNH